MRKILSALLILMLTVSNIAPITYAENEASASPAVTETNNRKKTKPTPTPTPKPSATPKAEKDEAKSEDKKTETKKEETKSNTPDVMSEAAILIETGDSSFEPIFLMSAIICLTLAFVYYVFGKNSVFCCH